MRTCNIHDWIAHVITIGNEVMLNLMAALNSQGTK